MTNKTEMMANDPTASGATEFQPADGSEEIDPGSEPIVESGQEGEQTERDRLIEVADELDATRKRISFDGQGMDYSRMDSIHHDLDGDAKETVQLEVKEVLELIAETRNYLDQQETKFRKFE